MLYVVIDEASLLLLHAVSSGIQVEIEQAVSAV
jgi:hypothetical protein